MAEKEFKVFISYAAEDRSFADSVARELESRGFAVWYDKEIRPGSRWKDAITTAVQLADAFVLYCSKAYLQSEWGILEIGAATGRALTTPGTAVIPVLGKGVRQSMLPPALRGLRTIKVEDASPSAVAAVVAEVLQKRREGEEAG
jgi:hypothetical protein